MNLPFALWLGQRKERRWLMVHEAAFPFVRGGPLRHDLLAIVTRAMLAATLAGSERVFMSTPAWEPVLQRYGFGRHRLEWLPVPASVPTTASAARVREIRRELSVAPDAIVVGHFGSYGSLIAEPLAPIVKRLAARHANWTWVMLGRGADRFVESMDAGSRPLNAIVARPNLSADEVSNHLGALDAVVLPFPDGISTRRTSAMAALAVGAPIVTTSGPSTESIWRLSDTVVLAGAHPETIADATTTLISDGDRRARLAARGRALYQERFDVGRLADTLSRSV
jgi:glycosyltransferase involved in cell wall biosynthesis